MMNSAFLIAMFFSVLNDTSFNIDVVYPRPANQDTIARIERVNFNFIFGSVLPTNAALKINGVSVPLEKSGAFLAYLPVDWGSQTYRLEAIINSNTSIEKMLPFSDRSVAQKDESVEEIINFPIELTLSAGVARSHPDGVYYLFPFQGTKIKAVSKEKGQYQVPLSSEKSVWVAEKHIVNKSPYIKRPNPIAWKAIVTEVELGEEVVIPLNSKPLYRVLSSGNSNTLSLDVYNVTTHIDIISYQNPAKIIREVVWEVPSDNVMRIKIRLSNKHWGYKVSYEDNALRILVRKPPNIRRGVRGLTIAVDPGHGGESDGSIGPLRTTEKEVNLRVALQLRDILESKGATVMLTRDVNKTLGLLERIKMAEDANADLMISLHHNALGDGKDPFGNLGTGVHYYNSLSRGLAEKIQAAVHKELDIYNEGVYYNNLAMVRPTYMPAILLEAAYMMIPEHEQMMLMDDYAERLAKAVYKGIKSYLRDERKIIKISRSSIKLNNYSADIFE
jgi:N-acetylmuramoyl-L-alanine amidase